MKRTRFNLFAILGILFAVTFAACDDDDDDMDDGLDDEEKGTANLAVTDATIDAENITGVYLLVDGVMFDSEEDEDDTTVTFETTQEFNVMTYQNGETYDLTSVDLNEGSYSGISLILSGERSGYVTFSDDTEADIEMNGDTTSEDTTSTYRISGEFEIDDEEQTDLVADIDLRKAFRGTSEGGYFLRPTGRLIEADGAGTIQGSVENYEDLQGGDSVKYKLVVYAYKEDEFDEDETNEGTEMEGRFENSINSAVVNENGEFTLAFMEEGDYELVVGVFQKDAAAAEEDEYEFNMLIETETESEGVLDIIFDGIDVDAGATADVTIRLGLEEQTS